MKHSSYRCNRSLRITGLESLISVAQDPFFLSLYPPPQILSKMPSYKDACHEMNMKAERRAKREADQAGGARTGDQKRQRQDPQQSGARGHPSNPQHGRRPDGG